MVPRIIGTSTALANWRKLDELTADDKVRTFVHKLMSGGDSPLLIGLGMPLNRFVTTGLLPQRVREQLHLSWSKRDQQLFDALMTILPPIYRLVPGRCAGCRPAITCGRCDG